MARWLKACLAGMLVTGICVGAAAWSGAKELTGRREDLQREARVIARLVVTRMEGGLEKHLTAMRQMANFYASSKKVGEKQFLTYAANTLKMSPACLNIAYVGPDLLIQRSYPPDTNRWQQIFDARLHPPGYETVLRANRTRRPMLSPPMNLFGGIEGFVLAEPVVANGRLLGTLVGACRSQEYFGSIAPPEVTERYEQVLLDSGTQIFTSDPSGTSDPAMPSVSESFDFGGATWEVRVKPQEWVVHDRLAAGRSVFWAMTALLALASGVLVSAGTFWAMWMSARIRSQGAALREVRSRFEGTREQLIQAEKMTGLGQLVAGVAHEINNPLASILGYSQLLMKQPFPQAVQKKLLTISSEAERMAKIVRNLLSFARRHAPEKQHQNLNSIIEETLSLKAYHLRSRQIMILKQLDPNLPPTMLDLHQIQQVLINLLNNAEQAMVEAHRGTTIRLATRAVEGRIEMRVSDDGPGVPPEIQERIFEPFFTTKKEGAGTGLGLSLCYGIVEEHGGKIRVESGPAGGTTFIIDLPILHKDAPTLPNAERLSRRRAPRMTVLVVDDEPSVQEFLVDVLALGGHSVDTASDVPEAIRKIATGAHDLVITDLMMPQGTGRDIYEAILQVRPHLARRVVFTTGHQANDETIEFLRKTGNELILKPCKIDEIENAVARAARN